MYFSALYRLLGHLYAGEALISLGKVTEAIQHLDPRVVGEVSLSPPTQDAPNTLPATTPSQGEPGR